jgi:hypothetical protein
MIAPFEASKLKIERAVEHLHEFDAAASSYLNSNPCAIVVEPFPGGLHEHMGTQSWNARIRKPVPVKFSTLIGDAVHNIRAALDVLICDLVRINNKSPNNVYFPFCASAADLPDTIRKRNVHRAGKDVVQAIESLKPYKGGNVALRLIHDLDIADKHQALLPVIGAVSLPLGQIFKTDLPLNVGNWQSIIDHDGQMIIGTPNILGLPPGTELPARFFLALNFPGIGVRPAIEGLHGLAYEADSIFKALTALRPGAVFPVVPPMRPKGGGP